MLTINRGFILTCYKAVLFLMLVMAEQKGRTFCRRLWTFSGCTWSISAHTLGAKTPEATHRPKHTICRWQTHYRKLSNTLDRLTINLTYFSYVRWLMSRLVSDSVPVHLHHRLSAAPDSLPSVTELFRSPLHVSGTVCQSLSLPHLP